MWWYSQDDERWNGPCDSRQEAIEKGRAYYRGEQFMVCEAETAPLNLRLTADTILEMFDGQNEDNVDPDCDPLFCNLSMEARSDLERAVNVAISGWIEKYEIDTKGYRFEWSDNQESIGSQNCASSAEAEVR